VLTATSVNQTYFNSTASITIRSSASAPVPPSLSYARFTDDGFGLTIRFNKPTDKAASTVTNYLGRFTCSQLLSFTSASSSECYWTSTESLTVAYNNKVSLGETITLLKQKLKPLCDSSVICQFANASSVSLTKPTNPISPSVLLSASKTVSACDSIVVDPTSSSGSGGRAFTGSISEI
jgi:hypothetical protein